MKKIIKKKFIKLLWGLLNKLGEKPSPIFEVHTKKIEVLRFKQTYDKSFYNKMMVNDVRRAFAVDVSEFLFENPWCFLIRKEQVHDDGSNIVRLYAELKIIPELSKPVVLTDESIMEFDIHKGKALENVPNDYLLWLQDSRKCFGALKSYIEENIDSIRKK